MTDEPLPALQPCPWCGSEAHITPLRQLKGVTGHFRVLCMNDECAIGPHNDFDTAEDAATAWNRRSAGPVREDIAPMLALLFSQADEVDALLDEDTYEQLRRDEFDPPLDADYSVRAGTALKCSRMLNQIDAIKRALEKIGTWATAYPIAVFPEPDFKRAHEVLAAAGISLDAISASNMRHVITQVQEIVERALRGPGGGENE